MNAWHPPWNTSPLPRIRLGHPFSKSPKWGPGKYFQLYLESSKQCGKRHYPIPTLIAGSSSRGGLLLKNSFLVLFSSQWWWKKVIVVTFRRWEIYEAEDGLPFVKVITPSTRSGGCSFSKRFGLLDIFCFSCVAMIFHNCHNAKN